MSERKTPRLLPLRQFWRRMTRTFLVAVLLIALALGIGVVGYHGIVGLSWIDAILNASMILTGMGPVAAMPTVASKLFASVYALFSGVVFLSAVGLLLSPLFHRVMHQFHLDDEGQ